MTVPATPIKRYLDVNGVHTYYEVHGEGEPVVLLHGGMCTIDTWSAQTAALAEHYQVFLPERRGHGRTPDVDGPLTYSTMADDTAAWMDAMGISDARVAGWSDGGNVGLILAMRRPDLVRKLIALGCAANAEGYGPKFGQAQPELESLPPMIIDAYKAMSPDGPEHLPIVFAKVAKLWKTEPTHELAELEAIRCPTLVMMAEDDVPTVGHAAAMARTIPDGQLAVLPGADHGVVFEKPQLVNMLFLDFFSNEQPPTLLG